MKKLALILVSCATLSLSLFVQAAPKNNPASAKIQYCWYDNSSDTYGHLVEKPDVAAPDSYCCSWLPVENSDELCLCTGWTTDGGLTCVPLESVP